MIYRKELHIVIAEPNPHLHTPYHDLARWGTPHRFETLEHAAEWMFQTDHPPTGLVCVSTSFRLSRIVSFLQIIKSSFLTEIVPLVLVVDLQQQVSFVPGTEWAKQIGILHSLSSWYEVKGTLSRITNTPLKVRSALPLSWENSGNQPSASASDTSAETTWDAE